MNVYNEAHDLAAALKGCDEVKQLNELRGKLAENPELSKLMSDFQAEQMTLQMKQMSGDEPDEESMQKFQQLYGIIMQDPLTMEYIQAEMRVSMMLNDIYQIIGEALGVTPPDVPAN